MLKINILISYFPYRHTLSLTGLHTPRETKRGQNERDICRKQQQKTGVRVAVMRGGLVVVLRRQAQGHREGPFITSPTETRR